MRDANDDAETTHANTASNPKAALDIPRKSWAVKSRLAEEALRKLEKENPDWKGIDYILNYGEGMGPVSSKTDGEWTVKELLDGMKQLRELRDETDDAERNQLWNRLKIGERINKAVGILSPFLPAVDVAVNFDPANAALPWAGIRVVLVVSTWIRIRHREANEIVASHVAPQG